MTTFFCNKCFQKKNLLKKNVRRSCLKNNKLTFFFIVAVIKSGKVRFLHKKQNNIISFFIVIMSFLILFQHDIRSMQGNSDAYCILLDDCLLCVCVLCACISLILCVSLIHLYSHQGCIVTLDRT